jgi:hypothetical protein
MSEPVTDQNWIKDDDRVAEIARDGIHAENSPTDLEIRALAAELHHRRKQTRHEHRRADEVRRLRWMAESLVTKVEDLERKTAAEDEAEGRRG